jgi:hypothetical protein
MKGVRITVSINVLRWVQATSPSMHHQAMRSSMRIAEKRRIRRSRLTRRRPGWSSTNRIFTTSTTNCARWCVTNQAWCCAAQRATSSSTCTGPAQSCRRNLPTIGSAPTAVRRASRGEEGWEGTAQSSAFVQGDGADEKGYKGEGLKEGGGGNN